MRVQLRGLKRHISILLMMALVLTTLMPTWAYGETNYTGTLTAQNVSVTTIHEDGSQGDAVVLAFDEATKTFSGNLGNYTDLKEFNDSGIAVALKGLPAGATAVLKNSAGEKIADFADGAAVAEGKEVVKKGEYSFVISLQNGGEAEEYTLKLTKGINMSWTALAFSGTPDFDEDVIYNGYPEGTLFQLDDEGNPTGKTGVSPDCYNYEVYVSGTTDFVKPTGEKALDYFKNSFVMNPPNPGRITIYSDENVLIPASPTLMALCQKWSQTDGIRLVDERTTMRVEVQNSKNDKDVVNTKVTFVLCKMDVDTLISNIKKLETENLIWPDDADGVNKLYYAFSKLSDEEKNQIPAELKTKLETAYEIMRPDRVPAKLEIVKKPSKLVYKEGQTFDTSGVELLATYDDGTTRAITDNFAVEPSGALTDETEVIFTYNTASVKQAIKLVKITLQGEGTEANPYKISSAMDLQSIYDWVASGEKTEGKYFEMTADITLPRDWKPIGITIDGSIDIKEGKNLYAFGGIIDGKGHTLTVPEGGLPLLGYVKGAEVKNLNIYGRKIAGYGLVNNLSGVGLSGSAIVLDNITLKSGSSTLKSGLIGTEISTNGFAGCSAGFATVIKNCTVEEGVVIGYNKDQSKIGSIGGRIHANIENCKSYATVYGTNYVGGILGTTDNAMGSCSVKSCEFGGKVEATGEEIGGIIGGGYSNGTAPNGATIYTENCSSSGEIVGKDKVGGIMGADSAVLQSWSQTTFKRNSFTGTVKATNGEYVGGVIGYLASLNKYSGISANYYSSKCGAEKGIGFVQYVDTSCETHETESGATYFDTSVELPGIGGGMMGGITKKDCNRTDDPLGKDAVVLTYSDGQTDPIAVDLAISGEYKTDYYVGEALDLSGMKLIVTFHTGETKELTAADVEIKDYDANRRGTQTVSLVYGAAKAQIEVTVMKPATGKITVYLSILGDKPHDAATTDVHTLAGGNLTEWLGNTGYEADVNATVWDVLKMAEEQNDKLSFSNPTGGYIDAVTYNGVKLSEVANGPNSGWMYTLNGAHPEFSVNQQYLEEGDVIVFHYTDDYTLEDWNSGVTAAEVIAMIDALAPADKLTLQDAAAVARANDAFNALSKEDKALVSDLKQKKLEEAVLRMAELKKAALSSIEHAYKTTGDYLMSLIKGNEEFGAEWPVIGLARAGRLPDEVKEAYYRNILEYVKANGSAMLDKNKATENARVILALTAIGKDVTNVAGYNLLAPLANLNYLGKQGINGPIWTLIAFDSHGYEIPKTADGTQVTRENLIETILGAQLEDGGWDLSGKTADPDMTAMAIQSLAPYYQDNAEVKAAVDKALECLSLMQNADGGYASWGTTNSESCAQVITALTALGIDPAKDARFIKNGNSAVDALLGFYTEDGGFEHVAGAGVNGMASEQGYYTLAAYSRMINGQTSLYDMTDVRIEPANTESGTGTVPNEKPDGTEPPKTGDTNSMMPWLILMLIGGSGATLIKRKEDKAA